MGFTTPNLPAGRLESFLEQPLMERIKMMALKWVDYGYGVPRMIHVIYIAKLVLFYAVGGIAIATVTSDLPAFWHVSAVVEPADRVPEGDPVDRAAGTHRPRRVMGSARRQDEADDWWATDSGRGPTRSGCGRGGGFRSPRAIGAHGSTSRCTWR